MLLKKSDANLDQWRAGAQHFNAAKYWHAHEEWEILWKRETHPLRKYIQGLIQACGAFHHLQNKRISPAMALSHLSLNKLRDSGLMRSPPIVEIKGLEDILIRLTTSSMPQDFLKEIIKLRATIKGEE